jgi:hypothetical protein
VKNTYEIAPTKLRHWKLKATVRDKMRTLRSATGVWAQQQAKVWPAALLALGLFSKTDVQSLLSTNTFCDLKSKLLNSRSKSK